MHLQHRIHVENVSLVLLPLTQHQLQISIDCKHITTTMHRILPLPISSESQSKVNNVTEICLQHLYQS